MEASGSYRSIGEQIGVAAAAQIHALVAMYTTDDDANGEAQVSVAAAMQAAVAECPHLLEELEGTAGGAGVTVEQLLRLNGGGVAMLAI